MAVQYGIKLLMSYQVPFQTTKLLKNLHVNDRIVKNELRFNAIK